MEIEKSSSDYKNYLKQSQVVNFEKNNSMIGKNNFLEHHNNNALSLKMKLLNNKNLINFCLLCK